MGYIILVLIVLEARTQDAKPAISTLVLDQSQDDTTKIKNLSMIFQRRNTDRQAKQPTQGSKFASFLVSVEMKYGAITPEGDDTMIIIVRTPTVS